MAGRSLKPQLNQIRAWVRQGRTDAWIAHQLEVSTSQLQEFRKQNGLDAESIGDSPAEVDIRDEIEAEIEAELDEIEDLLEEDEEEEDSTTVESPPPARRDSGQRQGSSRRSGRGEERQGNGRRRGKRGGRRRGKRGGKTFDATFEQGKEGYGLWLDPAIADEAVFTENWKGKRALRVTVEQGRIVLEPSSRD
ncbi:MAG: hypothetical protein ACKOBH_01325 [bacterium]